MHIIKPNPYSFGSVAWFYDLLAALIFGGAIRQSQKALLTFIPSQATVLIVGGGTGWILQDLVNLNIPLKITYLEVSSRMLEKAKLKVNQLPPNLLIIDFKLGSESVLKTGELYQIIFTPFVLDLYPETILKNMLKKLQEHLHPGGYWLICDFFVSQHLTDWQKYWRQKLLNVMYLFFGWLTGLPNRALPNLEIQMQNLPLVKIKVKKFYFGFIQAQVYQANVVKSNLAEQV